MANEDSDNPFARPSIQRKEDAGSSRGTPIPPMVNPYAATVDVSDTLGFGSDVEQFRQMYLKHEASIKSVGLLYMIPGVLLTLLGFGMLVAGLVSIFRGARPGGGDDLAFIVIAMTMYGLIGALQFYAGWGLRRFRPIARRIVIIFSAIGLIAFPFGTLISAYILYLLLSEKGKVVFSDDYQDAIQKTPHIKYRTSIAVWILVGFLVVVLMLGLVGIFVGA